jgi:hypothetical protein
VLQEKQKQSIKQQIVAHIEKQDYNETALEQRY